MQIKRSGMAMAALMASFGLLASPAAAVNYSFVSTAFNDMVAFSSATPITGQTILNATSCSEGSFIETDCQILMRPAGSAAITFNGISFAQSVADGFAIAFDPGTTYYLELATDALGINGDHVIGSASLTVTDAPVSPTGGGTYLTTSFDGGSIGTDGQHVNGTSTQTVASLASEAPEPATWSMMIAGFGLIGGAMRRRRGATGFAPLAG